MDNDFTNITVYGLVTEKKIRAIKTLRSVYYAVERIPMGLKLAKETVDALAENNGAQVSIRVQTHTADLVRSSLYEADFVVYPPSVRTILNIG